MADQDRAREFLGTGFSFPIEVDEATGEYVYYDNHDWQKDLLMLKYCRR